MINMEGFFFNSSSFAEWMWEQKDGGSSSGNLIFVNTLSFCGGSIKCLDANTDLDLVVALSNDQELLYHSLSSTFSVTICNVDADSVMISNLGFVVTCNIEKCEISCFSMNGSLLRTCRIDSVSHLEPLSLSNRGKNIAFCASVAKRTDSVCSILVYDLLSMETIFEKSLKAYVAGCAFSNDDTNLVAVLDDGEVLVFFVLIFNMANCGSSPGAKS